jgi:hypothetical protein
VNDPDRVKLLFGPYQAPRLQRGDRAHCVYRDTIVVVTSWTDAPIPWPRCRALDLPGGGSGLLVDDELARAVHHESAAAVIHWWGVSQRAVWAWRRALGVGRADSEGSRRLIRCAAEKGAARLRGKSLPPEQVERRRRTAIEKGLGRNLVTGYHGPRWTKRQLRLLGKMSDDQAARRTGRTPNAVRVMRTMLGIPTFRGGSTKGVRR